MLGVKRTLDLAGLNEALVGSVGGHASGCTYRATPTKRNRMSTDAFGGDGAAGGCAADFPGGAQSPMRSNGAGDERFGGAAMVSPSAAAAMASQFPRRGVAGEELDELVSHCVQGINNDRKHRETQSSLHHENQQQQPAEAAPGCGGDKKYSTEDVREIVRKAVELREEALRLEYGALMQDKLSQQFSMFTTHNQDFISRQIKGNPFSYVS